MKWFSILLGMLTLTVVAGEKTEVAVTYPRSGGSFPAGTSRTMVMGFVKPKDAPLTCNGKPVEVYRKTGAFLVMLPLASGKNQWTFQSGDVKTSYHLIVKKPHAAVANAPKIVLKSFQTPTGFSVGEEVVFSCKAPANRVIGAAVGEREFQLKPSADDPTLYQAKFRYNSEVHSAPVLFWGEGLKDVRAEPLTVLKDWPVYEVVGDSYYTRARTLPGDGDTLGFPMPGVCVQPNGFRDGWMRCQLDGKTAWIARSALKEVKGKKPVSKLPDLSVGFPARPAKGKQPKDLLIMIDPGHGGEDSGAMGPSRTKEADANLKQAKLIQKALEKAGFRVKLTRTTDKTVGLYERVRMAVDSHADAFISVHHNACALSTDPREIRHFISFGWNRRGLDLVRPLHAALLPCTGGLTDRGVHQRSFAVCRNPSVPSCLIEFDFINCPEGEDAIFNSGRMEKYADAIVVGLKKWMSATTDQSEQKK